MAFVAPLVEAGLEAYGTYEAGKAIVKEVAGDADEVKSFVENLTDSTAQVSGKRKASTEADIRYERALKSSRIPFKQAKLVAKRTTRNRSSSSSRGPRRTRTARRSRFVGYRSRTRTPRRRFRRYRRYRRRY